MLKSFSITVLMHTLVLCEIKRTVPSVRTWTICWFFPVVLQVVQSVTVTVGVFGQHIDCHMCRVPHCIRMEEKLPLALYAIDMLLYTSHKCNMASCNRFHCPSPDTAVLLLLLLPVLKREPLPAYTLGSDAKC